MCTNFLKITFRLADICRRWRMSSSADIDDVSVFGRRNFVSALQAVMWEQLECEDLKARAESKEKIGRDFELLLFD